MESVPLRAIPARTQRYLEKEKPWETGGLLWGTVIPEGPQKLVLISHADFVSCETASFNSSPVDLLALSAALGRPKAGLAAIGYFRSDIGPQTGFREQEKAFFERSLRDADSVFLLVRTLEDGTCMARFLLRENGRLQESKYLEELPVFERHGAAPSSLVKRGRPDVLVEAQKALSLPDDALDDPQELDRVDSEDWQYGSQNQGAIWRYGLVAALAAVLGVSAYAFRSQLFPLRTYEGRTLDSNIALQVSRRSDGQLDLAWNRDLPALQSAHGAVLSIKDGPYSREIQLGEDQLRSGKLVYFPAGADIQFHLEIFLDQMRSIGESVRVISHDIYPSVYSDPLSRVETAGRLAMEPMLSGTRRNPTRPAETSVEKQSAPGGVALAPVLKPAENNSSHETPGVPPTQETIHKESIPPKDAVPATQVSASLPSNTTGPSSISSNPVRTGLLLQSGHEAPIKSENAVRTISTRAGQEPLGSEPPKPVNTPLSTVPASGPTVLNQLLTSPPQPLKKVVPNTKPFGASLITSDMNLDVLVNVDGTGKVVEAHIVNSALTRHSLLVSEAIEAAKQWKFTPAQRGGANVSGTYLIQFRFRTSK
jgi:TonB family protein